MCTLQFPGNGRALKFFFSQVSSKKMLNVISFCRIKNRMYAIFHPLKMSGDAFSRIPSRLTENNFQVPATVGWPTQDVRLTDDPRRIEFWNRREWREPRRRAVGGFDGQRADHRELWRQ